MFRRKRADEFLRLRRERQFLEHVLATIRKPTSNRWLAILSSPFFIWLLTLVFLVLGGAYFTRMQQCVGEAEQVIEKRERLETEMDNRRKAIAGIEKANSLQEIREEHLPNSYPDFKERSLLDISSEFAALFQSIDESRAACSRSHYPAISNL